MSIFGKRERSQRILPDGLVTHLVVYGQDEFGLNRTLSAMERVTCPAAEAIQVLARLQTMDETTKRAALAEMKDTALGAGGWAVYGASYAVLAFLPFTSGAEELHEARIEFLRQLDVPNKRAWLKPDDIVRWKELYPGEVERL